MVVVSWVMLIRLSSKGRRCTSEDHKMSKKQSTTSIKSTFSKIEKKLSWWDHSIQELLLFSGVITSSHKPQALLE